MCSSRIVFLLFFASYCASETLQIPRIARHIQKFISAGCINVIQNKTSGLRATNFLAGLQYELSSEYLQTSILSTQTGCLDDCNCQRGLPLNVLLPKTTREFVQHLVNRTVCHAAWLLFLDAGTQIVEFFTDINIPFDCEFLVAQPADGGILLTEIYRVAPTLPLQVYRLGTWTPESGMNLSTLSFYQRRSHVHGIQIKTVFRESFVVIISNVTGTLHSVSGYFGEIWNILQKHLNFITDFRYPEDGNFGKVMQNGSWNGAMGMVQRKEVDFGCSSFLMTRSRNEAVKFLSPLLDVKTTLAIKEPNSFEVTWTEFLKPFSWQLWAAQLISMFLVCICLTVSFRIGRHYGREGLGEPSFYSIEDAVLNTVFIYSQKSQDGTPRSVPCRTVYWTAQITALILMSGYSACLISYLTTREVKLPFTSLREFLELNDFQLEVLANSAFSDYFKNSSDEVLMRIDKKFIANRETVAPKSEEEGLRRVCVRDRYAYMTFPEVVSLHKGPCKRTIVPKINFPGSVSVITNKDNPYREIFNYKIINLRTSGLLRRLHNKFFPKSIKSSEIPQPEVDLFRVKPIFAIYSVALLSSLLLLLAEIRRNRRSGSM
ncbi:probable glutamate receptor [Periplaneta americana]|uniref:probable glutamate receptor n=1 Tax=Periplaneta americana TaxID=6978 RepID=UPI0037E71C2E